MILDHVVNRNEILKITPGFTSELDQLDCVINPWFSDESKKKKKIKTGKFTLQKCLVDYLQPTWVVGLIEKGNET